jgi:(E)-4-hydroxy-3-methyl-but-2-enyl pyrophosphate reductase
MKIELAKNSGFCMGVRDAILRIVHEINTTDEIIYVYGPLIHNPQTVEVLDKRGLRTINSFDTIDDQVVAIRTHGIELDNFREIRSRAKRYINLTCSRVARVQGIIKKYSNRGYFTIIIGDRDHAEVIGLKSYASSGVVVVSKVGEVKSIPESSKYIIVSQTTLDTELFEEVIREIKTNFSNVVVINTICDSTHNRQGDVKRAIESGIDALVVVGGKNSANTQRLAQIGRDKNINTFHIETESDLDKNRFNGINNVLVTAGASTPGWIINRVLEKLYDIKYENSNILINLLKKISEFMVRTNLFSAITAFFITLFIQKYFEKAPDYSLSLISFLYIFSMYTINNYFELVFLRVSNPYKFVLYDRFKHISLPLSIISIVISFILIAINYDYLTLLIFGISATLGSIYSTERIKSLFYNMKQRVISKIYFSKSIVVTFGWVIITTLIPSITLNIEFYKIIVVSAYVFTFIFLRSILLDCIAFQGDLILGRETLPILLGIKRTRLLVVALSILSVSIFGIYSYLNERFAYLLFIITIIYFLILLTRVIKLNYLIALKYELLVDLNLLLFIILYLITAI